LEVDNRLFLLLYNGHYITDAYKNPKGKILKAYRAN